MSTIQLSLEAKDVRLLLQSLDHCLATCTQKPASTKSTCEDCERARALRERLAKHLSE
jgi:hypothetical protein